jgi:predicted enzyme related to lactoylglutathione lyase
MGAIAWILECPRFGRPFVGLLTEHKTRQEIKIMSAPKKSVPANIGWFEIPADNPERATAFYGKLFGWKVKPFPGMTDYWHIETGGPDAAPDGGLMKRTHPARTITNYINAPSVTRFMAKVEKLGGSTRKPKTAAPLARFSRGQIGPAVIRPRGEAAGPELSSGLWPFSAPQPHAGALRKASIGCQW